MAGTSTYTGFSTVGAERTRSWRLYDIDLVKRDLLNHFMTRFGERVGRPDFGCKIWDLLMENQTPGVRQEIIDEVVRVCSTDPRVTLHDVHLFEFDNGLRIQVTLDYKGLAVMQQFEALFEIEQDLAFNQAN